MSGYQQFSHVYDQLMGRVDYEARATYLQQLFAYYGQQPACLLDIGCGTGRITRLLAHKGYEMIGVDASPEMLSIAREQTNGQEDILWVCQDMRELDLFGTAQGAISTLDCVNHLTDLQDIRCFFGRLQYFLESGNLFIFDVNTPYKHKEILGNHTFVYDTPSVYCVWQNTTDETLTTHMCLDFFEKQGQGYVRTTERFAERAYTRAQWEQAAGRWFELVDVWEDMTLQPPHKESQRVVCVMKKK